jgi:hypothetical protein
MLFAVGAVLFAFFGSQVADAQIVRWDRVEGFGAADTSAIAVGPIFASRGRTVGTGRVMLNLKTGFFSFAIQGMTNGKPYDNGPLGAPWSPGSEYPLMGTVVCDSTQRFSAATWVDSQPVAFNEDGDGRFEGFVDVPQACKDRPMEMVFLVRHARPDSPLYGRFVAYGAGRTIR